MKKQFLNLGKALSRAEQKEVFGGLHYIKHYDENCDVADSLLPPGCGCTSSSECGFTGIPDPSWNLATYAQQRGTCTAGRCH